MSATCLCAVGNSVVCPADEDRYWRHALTTQRYWRPGLDYEDYAPAYCVGYSGFLQYGGDFADAQVSLDANWQRLRGDSRLGASEAGDAIRAAWERMAARTRDGVAA